VHRSRISAICLDVPIDRREASEEFWANALGLEFRHGTTHDEFSVGGEANSHLILLQAISAGHPGVHLDVHTDDRDAEVRRLTTAGAREIARHGDWVVLEDPAGITFCVVPVAGDDATLTGAREWD
jgi:catechol 2,3-dioxygenase-like lactoylglutathione lyase family enzyme